MLSISSTTRAPRGNEKHGIEYFFISHEEFEQKKDAGLFAEWARVHDNYYGTSKEVIEKAWASGKSVLLDIDVQGADSLRASYPNRTFAVFVEPPSLQELEARLRARATDKEETIQKRLKNAAEEISAKGRFDRVVVNDSLDRAYEELKALVASELRGSDG
jgi:guanylate kinase